MKKKAADTFTWYCPCVLTDKMQVKELRLVNFRNNKYSELMFTDGVNVIYGENAAGKTNILESIFILPQVKASETVRTES